MLRGDKVIDDINRELAADHANKVTDDMIQVACVAGYGVDTDKDSNLYKLMKRALIAALSI